MLARFFHNPQILGLLLVQDGHVENMELVFLSRVTREAVADAVCI